MCAAIRCRLLLFLLPLKGSFFLFFIYLSSCRTLRVGGIYIRQLVNSGNLSKVQNVDSFVRDLVSTLQGKVGRKKTKKTEHSFSFV